MQSTLSTLEISFLLIYYPSTFFEHTFSFLPLFLRCWRNASSSISVLFLQTNPDVLLASSAHLISGLPLVASLYTVSRSVIVRSTYRHFPSLYDYRISTLVTPRGTGSLTSVSWLIRLFLFRSFNFIFRSLITMFLYVLFNFLQ